MSSSIRWAWRLALISVLFTSSIAFADAREHFRRGQAAYQQGNYDLAISEWLAGYQLEQRPEFQYNLAQAYERLGRLQDAVVSLQSFVGTADPDDSSYSDATARLASLQQRLALTGVRALGGIEGAAIYVDGRDWGRLPRPDKIAITPGSHQIVVRLAGYKDFVSNVVVPAGQVIDIEVVMEPGVGTAAPVQVAPAAAPGTTVDQPQLQPPAQQASVPPAQAGALPPMPAQPTASGRSSLWLIVGISTGMVAVGSLIGYADRSGKAKECSETANFCHELDAVEAEETLWGVSTLLFGAASITSFVLYALSKGESQDATLTTSASCAPGLLSGQCTVTF